MQLSCMAPSFAIGREAQLAIKHIELEMVDAGIAGAGIDRAMVRIAYFRSDLMAIVDPAWINPSIRASVPMRV